MFVPLLHDVGLPAHPCSAVYAFSICRPSLRSSLSSLTDSSGATRESLLSLRINEGLILFWPSYYSLVQVVYESFVLSAFLLLIVQYVANTADSRTAEGALARKDKTRLIIPVNIRPFTQPNLKRSCLSKSSYAVSGIGPLNHTSCTRSNGR